MRDPTPQGALYRASADAGRLEHDHADAGVRPGCVACHAEVELDALAAWSRGRTYGEGRRFRATAIAFVAGLVVGVAAFWWAERDASSPGSGPVATATAPAFAPAGPDRNCSDFTTWVQAQAFYIAAGGPEADPHRLDRDRDGIACQSLPGAPR